MKNTFLSLLRIILVVLAPLLLSNCMTDTGPAVKPAASEPTRLKDPALAASPATADSPVDYRIAPRDIVEVSVFQVPDLNKTVQVSDDGNISLPLIGKMQIGGKTTHEAEQIIGDKLRKKYMQSPQVGVFVKQYGQRVTVSGEVKHRCD